MATVKKNLVRHAGQEYAVTTSLRVRNGAAFWCSHFKWLSPYASQTQSFATTDVNEAARWFHARNLPRKKVLTLFKPVDRKKISWRTPR